MPSISTIGAELFVHKTDHTTSRLYDSQQDRLAYLGRKVQSHDDALCFSINRCSGTIMNSTEQLHTSPQSGSSTVIAQDTAKPVTTAQSYKMWQQELCLRLQPDKILPPSTILQPQTSPLLLLPAELRNNIYDYLFPFQAIFNLIQGQTSPPVLNTCKQLRYEVTGIFYSNTIIQFNDPKLLVRHLMTLSPNSLEMISELRYDTSEICTQATSWRSAFRELPGLDEDTKLQALRDKLENRGVVLRVGVLKARIRIGCQDVWTADPLEEALEGVKKGKMVGRMMFV